MQTRQEPDVNVDQEIPGGNYTEQQLILFSFFALSVFEQNILSTAKQNSFASYSFFHGQPDY
jgi:hypothetical protein